MHVEHTASYYLTLKRATVFLKAAIDANDDQIVRHLLDWRHADGRRAIDPRRILFNGETPIRYAGREHGTAGNPPSLTIIEILQQAIEEADREIGDQILEEKEQKIGEMAAEVKRVVDNTQNTHLTEVTLSVNESIKRLRVRYGVKEKVDSDSYRLPHKQQVAAIKEIKEYLTKKQKDFIKAESAWTGIRRVEKDDTERLSLGCTLSEAISLVWLGVQDKKLENLPLSDVLLQMESDI